MVRKILILGHRGYRKKFPENTILSFTKAFEFRADGLECDIQRSSDGVYFVFHDMDMERLTGISGDINSFTADRIKSMKVAGKERIQDIDSFLALLPDNKFINIELKEETLTIDDSNILIDKLNKRRTSCDILISSFNHALLPPFKKAGYKTGMLYETETFKNHPLKNIIGIFLHRPWSVNIYIGLFAEPQTLLLRAFAAAARLLRIKFIFWTVNNADQFNAVKDIAHAIITDEVEELVRIRADSCTV
ncbi:MAG: hypothetical protein FWG49_06940 [Leptospirales bacterium]|nr:hypothetical protein [Leptospirales bacterium]